MQASGKISEIKIKNEESDFSYFYIFNKIIIEFNRPFQFFSNLGSLLKTAVAII
jgi:hypothetical protein